VNDFKLPFFGFTRDNNDSNTMIFELYAFNLDSTNVSLNTHILTITTPSDYAITSNTEPVAGKLELNNGGSLILRKIGPSGADVTFSAFTITYETWNH